MPYKTLATSDHPALLILLLDTSGSMQTIMKEDGKRRIDVVWEAYLELVEALGRRATKGRHIQPRYRVALFTYNNGVEKVLDKTTAELDSMLIGPPIPDGGTNTQGAFKAAKDLLERELPRMQHCPAPLVLHLTDGEYTGSYGDPEPIARQILAMSVPDGHVLIENIFISDGVLPEPIADPMAWPGIRPDTTLASHYAEKLRAMSSPLPESYRQVMAAEGYQLTPGALMLLPGKAPGLVVLGFQIAGVTGVGSEVIEERSGSTGTGLQ